MQAIHKVVESGVGAERVGNGVDGEVNEEIVAFAIGLIEPSEGLVLFPEPGINACEINRGNVSRLGKVFKFGDDLPRPGFIAGGGKSMTVGHQYAGIVAGLLAREVKLLDSLSIHFFLATGRAEPEASQNESGE